MAAKWRPSARQAIDTGTPERARQGEVVVDTRVDPETGRRTEGARVVGVEPLDLYRTRGRLTRGQYLAGDRLRQLFRRAGIVQGVTSSWAPRVQSGRSLPAMSESAAEAHHEYGKAMRAAGILAPFAESVCCYGESVGDFERRHGWRRDSGMLVLRLALGTLAVHFGLLGLDEAQAGIGRPGAEDAQ